MYGLRRTSPTTGMIQSPIPTFSYGGTTSNTTTFTITNYNRDLSYSIVKTSGTGNTPSLNTNTGVITTTGVTGDINLSVQASAYKGGATSTSTQPSRRVYTFYSYTCQVNIGPCNVAMPDGGSAHYANCHGPGTCHARSATPAGYSDSGSDWYRV